MTDGSLDAPSPALVACGVCTARRGASLSLFFTALVASALVASFNSFAQDASVDVVRDPDGGALSDVIEERLAPADPRVAQVWALLGDALGPEVSPQSLFDVRLDDELAVRVEAVQVRALLDRLDFADAGADAGRARRPDVALGDATAATVYDEIARIDPGRFRQRVELDRARLAFYVLSEARRAELLSRHAARVEAARPRETEQQRLAREAEAEHARALAAARRARSEAERLVGDEIVRLIGVQQAVLAARAGFQTQRDELAAKRDTILGWQRRARAAQRGAAGDPDALYDAIRQTLRSSRDELDEALDRLGSTTTALPGVGADALLEVPVDIPTGEARARRRSVEGAIREARAEELSLREARATALFEACIALNRERLALLPSLSAAKRDSITGFTAAGLDQARAEARQLSLILRYHRHLGARWLSNLREHGRLEGVSVWKVLSVGLPILVVLIGLIWARRHTPSLLRVFEERLISQDRLDRRTTPGALLNGLRFLMGIHVPLERLIIFQVLLWLTPSSVLGTFEVQLLTTTLGWSLVGALVVNAINAATAKTTATSESDAHVDGLRLRSLRLVGRVVVGFGLILVLSARLVGEGTVYHWAFFSCWFAAIPVFLILVSWWRTTVFERVGRARRKSPLQAWVLEHREGWQSFFAAMIAAVHMFATGSIRFTRNWLGDFELVRRAHAYLFKRELDRLAEEESKEELAREPLNREAFESLSPDRPGGDWIECPAEEHRRALLARVARGRGGVVAVIGRMGLGKTSMFTRLCDEVPDARLVPCDAHPDAAQISRALDSIEGARPSLVILDDAHAMVKPVFGGLRAFDETLAYARAHSEKTLWVFSIDEIVWPFLRRARDSRPLFDELIHLVGWTDEQIGALLTARNREAGLTPRFDDLLEPLPPTSDEIDRQEALAAKRLGYFRMVWDYARGNPAIALAAWRGSLVEGTAGDVRVRGLQTPSLEALETLPDAALFVLRAVLQMSPATADSVAEATHLPPEQVENVFRFGRARGYLTEDRGRLSVPWVWRRAVILMLERRHLLVNS